MTPTDMTWYTAFVGTKKLTEGPLSMIPVTIKQKLHDDELHDVLIFSDMTGQHVDLDLRGGVLDVQHRARMHAYNTYVAKSRGRPKLGVVSREISLLPRHWEWLETQSGGASATLRKLVEKASKMDSESERQARDRTYQFLRVIAGDMPGYEEALRSLFRGDLELFSEQMKGWPEDVQTHARKLVTVH